MTDGTPTPAPPQLPNALVRLASLGAKAVLALAVVVAIVLLAVGFLLKAALPHLGNPFGEDTVERSQAPLQLSLVNLSQYHAASGTFQVVLDVEQDRRFIPSFISGERTIFLATGSVDGFVDFGNLSPDRVVVDQAAKSVVITLPTPQLAEPSVDTDASRVLSRDRGLAERVGSVFSANPGTETEFFQLAKTRLAEAGDQSDVRDRAQTNTRDMLTSLATSLGFTSVTVNFEAPPQ